MNISYKTMLPIALLATIAAVSIFGCGSSEDAGETSPPLTKAQFLQRGNQICKKGLEEKDAVVKSAVAKANAEEGGKPSQQRQEEVAEDILVKFQQIKTELDELSPPAESEESVENIMSSLEAGLEKAEENPLSLLRTNLFEKSSSAATAYGLEACSF